ncbi:unnamed protein product [Echinostoma caproni]|uniref:glutamate synthase (NADH) n=1 Tax=Echinostoma caproni TaxID=27848 RepID=A0A3P8GZ32_9TREM|nr:unnamed protein product [Echinostoma caproni]
MNTRFRMIHNRACSNHHKVFLLMGTRFNSGSKGNSGWRGGRSSWTGIKHAGLPWELGIAETHQILVHQRTRSRVLLQVDGQIRTGRDVIVAALLGADEFAMSTAPLIVLGCIMMRKCHLNTCPVGIATQDPVLRAKFAGQPEHVINYLFLLAEEVREYMSKLGARRLDDIIGHTEYLKDWDPKNDEDLSPIGQLVQYLHTDRSLDCALIKLAQPILETPAEVSLDPVKATVSFESIIGNADRAFGSTLSFAISRQFDVKGLPEGREIKIVLKGSAGQSFCAFLARGVTVRLEGDANDYVAKGLSGGRVTIVPPRGLLEQGFQSHQNLIVGNVCLYGATDGVLFLRGQAAERFCVRNSGAVVVAEAGVGDHGCEYMTGGRAVILGRTGRNFAAGMSGGLAFVYDTDGIQGPFGRKCNQELVDLEPMTLENTYAPWLQTIIEEFTAETGSEVGAWILNTWETSIKGFILVFPRDYKRALVTMEAKSVVHNPLDNNHVQVNSLPVTPIPVFWFHNNFTPTHLRVVSFVQVKRVNDIEDFVRTNPSCSPPSEKDAEELDKLHGFVRYARHKNAYRPVEERVNDWAEVYDHSGVRKELRKQAARCMDCGVPFCQSYVGCPLGNLIPNWNDLVFNNDWHSAHLALLQTNNFPEFTGRVCPAPCEAACVLGLNSDAVTIKNIECAIADKAWEQGWIQAGTEQLRGPTGRRVAIVGSGPAGLACADQLNKAGHEVTVIERRDEPGGLLRYGIPTMKLDRRVLDRRLELMRANGIRGRHDLNADNGNTVELPSDQLLNDYDAIVLCLGSTWPRDLDIPGRHLNGIHFAMSFLEQQHRKLKHAPDSRHSEHPDETDKRVVVLGGGDTGVDCLATSLRQGAKSVHTLEILPPPPPHRDEEENPWPEWPRVWRAEYGHAEVALRFGRDPRQFNTVTKEFLDNGSGSVCGLRTVQVEWSKNVDSGRWHMRELSDTEAIIECDLVLLAMGFVGPETSLIRDLGLATEQSESKIKTQNGKSYATSVPRVFTAGDCRRGQSLVVHAINEAREVDLYLMGSTQLPGQGGHVRVENYGH